jgi:AcrR family transcriptional regulator
VKTLLEERPTPSFEVLGRHYDLPYDISLSPTKEKLLITATELFAIKGYSAVSMRDIAQKVDITPGALYNHFDSKETIWDAVIDQAATLYLLYFKNLEEEMKKAESIEALLDTIFVEPLKMSNVFTTYAFALIQTQQFCDKKAGQVYSDIFIGQGVKAIKTQFDVAIKKGFAKKFDTQTTAALIIQEVMSAINMKIQEDLGVVVPYTSKTQLNGIKQLILQLIREK